VLENDWLEAIIALPLNIFYNTGIATYIWVLANKKAEARRDKVQLIDASGWFQPLRRNLGKKNCELSDGDIQRIIDIYLGEAQETAESKWFDTQDFGYWKITVERPLRLKSQLSDERIELCVLPPATRRYAPRSTPPTARRSIPISPSSSRPSRHG
jgi:type I restriction enzyme M protein